MVRIFLSSILLVAALLVVLRPPTHFLWMVAVAVTSYCFIWFLLTGVIFIWNWWAPQYRWWLWLLNGSTMILLSLPMIAAFKKSSQLTADLQQIFPVKNTIDKPAFLLSNCFKQSSFDAVVPLSLTYATGNGYSLTLDLYQNVQHQTAPLVLVVHGGSWESGDSKQLPELNSYLATQGFNVAAINYRLAPAYRFPAPVEDVKKAIQYLSQHAATYHIDTSNVVLLGRSAGAQIALVAAYQQAIPGVKGVIDYYGPADMVWGGQAPVNKWMLDVDKIYQGYFGGNYLQVPEIFQQASATNYVNATTVPTLIIHGATDAMVSPVHSQHLISLLRQHQVPSYYLNLPFATHGCDYNLNGPDGQLCTFAVLHFLQSVTQP